MHQSVTTDVPAWFCFGAGRRSFRAFKKPERKCLRVLAEDEARKTGPEAAKEPGVLIADKRAKDSETKSWPGAEFGV